MAGETRVAPLPVHEHHRRKRRRRPGITPPRGDHLTDYRSASSSMALTGGSRAPRPGASRRGSPRRAPSPALTPIQLTHPHSRTNSSHELQGKAAIVTGANRGFGRLSFAQQLRDRGVTVYAAVRGIRRPSTWRASRRCGSTSRTLRPSPLRSRRCRMSPSSSNNAGVATGADLHRGRPRQNVRHEFEMNFFGTLLVTRVARAVAGRAFWRATFLSRSCPRSPGSTSRLSAAMARRRPRKRSPTDGPRQDLAG